MTRLPTPGSDSGSWGDILNNFLEVAHNPDGSLANNTVGTNQIKANAVTNTQLDSSTQASLAKANSSVQTINNKSPNGSGAVTLAASDLNAIDQTTADSRYIQDTAKGAANGVATLDGSSKLTSGQLPGGVVTSSSIGYLSLRGDFGLNPSMSASSLTTAINSAIATAISAGKGLDFGADLWSINGPLTVGGSITLRAVGAAEVYGTSTNSQLGVRPGSAPWVQGGGIIQMAAATNILNITATGPTVHLRDLVLMFGGSSAFNNTGHGVYGVSTATTGTPALPDNGPAGCRWDNVVVFGTDGNHYAFYTVNMFTFTASHLRGYGGGGWYQEASSSQGSDGNGTLIEPYFCLFVGGGTADGFHMKSSGSAGTQLSLVTMIRPQALTQNVNGTNIGTTFGITVAPVSGVNHPYYDEGVMFQNLLIAPDMEPVSFPCVFAAGTTIIGPEYSSRTALHNTSYGAGALPGTPTGARNVGVGDSALNALTTANQNVAVGYQALLLDTTGSNNVAIGHSTLAAAVSAASNTAVGAFALAADTTGASNTAIGTASMQVNTTGSSNVAVGPNTLVANTTGSDNIAVGLAALQTSATGIRNVAIGSGALKLMTVSNGVAVGYQALAANTTGTGNTAVGLTALTANTTATNNTALGSGTLAANTTGGSNTAIGQGTLALNVTGANNTGVGAAALLSNTGTNNTGLGFNALELNTSGANNTAVGVNALVANTTANGNTAVGQAALSANTTGASNAAVGASVGVAITTGNFNTMIGASAGNTDGTTATTGTISGATMIGYQAQATTSNVIVLGSGITANRPNLVFGQAGVSGAFGGGVGVFGIANAVTLPASNPVGGGVLYVTGGALTYRGSSGTVTTVGVA